MIRVKYYDGTAVYFTSEEWDAECKRVQVLREQLKKNTPFYPIEENKMSKELTPEMNAIANDLLRVVADVLDLGYAKSGTMVNGRYIEVKAGQDFPFSDDLTIYIGGKQTKKSEHLWNG